VAENKVAAMYQKKQATAQQAEAVVDALMKVFDQPLFDWERPRVVVDTWEQGRTVVVWEEGPHRWMWVFPRGGMLNGTSWEIPKAELPKGVWVEPYDGCAVSVYQAGEFNVFSGDSLAVLEFGAAASEFVSSRGGSLAG
jgi:hypothetical protein